jgi:hypothetical protein
MTGACGVVQVRRRSKEGARDATNLREKLGLDNQRGISGKVALAENLEVAVSSDIDDRHLLLGDGLSTTRVRWWQ